MRKNIAEQMIKCSDALSKNDNPTKTLKDKSLAKIGITSFLKFHRKRRRKKNEKKYTS